MAIDTNHTSFDSDSHEIALVDLGVAQSTSDIRSTPLDPDEIALPQTVVKRDGRVVAFDPNRIERAIERCFAAIGRIPCSGAGNDSRAVITDYALRVVNIASARRGVLTVETIQDAVEWTLQAAGEFEAAKAYILYRAEHAKQRHEERRIPDEVRAAFDAAEQYFPTQLQKFQFFDKYSRFDPVLGRRETWIETIDRAVHHLNWLAQRETGKSLDEIRQGTTARLRMSMLNAPTEKGGAMSSMRLLATAGPAAERDDCCLYNCSFLPVESFKAFSMALQISMAGTGVGFSVERVHVDRFPRIARQKYAAENPRQPTVVFEDSAEGWGQGLDQFLEMVAVQGLNPRIDVSQIRPAGAPLKTKGGTASGPEPLIELLDFCRKVLLRRQSETLRTIDAYDMMCVVGTAAVSGGHRRSAMICLFDRDDDLMLHAKDGEFWHENQQRFNANNSAVWPHDRRVTRVELAQQMTAMLAAGGGEPGIFNLRAALDKRPDLRKERDAEWLADPQLNPWGLDYMAYGTNPCHRGSNQVHTSEGLVSIRELAGRDDFSVLLPTGEVARAVACRTGIRPLFRVVLDDGKTIDLTKNHNLILADGHKRMVKDLRPGDQIKLATHEFATTTAEVRGNRSVASATTTLERPLVQAIPNAAKSAALAEIKDLRVTEEVFNLTVDHPLHQFAVNGVISANCGEIVLRPWAFCNLSIVVSPPGGHAGNADREDRDRDYHRHHPVARDQLPLPPRDVEEQLRAGTAVGCRYQWATG